jgi:uncharacterized protein YbjT (DUF2867 family)
MTKMVICGATGTQGGAVYEVMKSLEDWELVGFSRDLAQPKADNLKARGLTMLEGDLADPVSLESAFAGADTVFGLTQPWNKSYTRVDTDLEWRQGKNIVEACLKNNVKFLVFSSAAHGEEQKTGLPHVDVKIDIEEYVRKSGLRFTFLNPVQFMDNVGMKFLPVKKGRIRGFIDGDAKVPYVAVRDIGLMTRIVLQNQEAYNGKMIGLVGDQASGFEMAAIFSRLRNEKFKYSAVPRLFIRLASKAFYKMRQAFEDSGRNEENVRRLDVAIKVCREINPEMFSMEDYLQTAG